MAALSEIQNSRWGIGLQGYGAVVQGISCLRQRIDIAIRTSQGSDPMRPLFGTKIYALADSGMVNALPQIKYEIISALTKWVPEVQLKSITHTVTAQGQIQYAITVVDSSGVIDTLSFSVTDGVIQNISDTKLVLSALIPDNPNGFRYKVLFNLNNSAVNPLVPVVVFESVYEMFNWLQLNWTYLAEWNLFANSISAFVKDPVYTNGLFVIGLISISTIRADVPTLDVLQQYYLELLPLGNSGDNVIADTPFSTLQAMVDWANAHWSSYGNWGIETVSGDFNGDFNSDFNLNKTYLVLYTEVYSAAIINLTIR